MSHFFIRAALVIIALLQFSSILYGGELDDFYLEQFGEADTSLLHKALLSTSSGGAAPVRCGVPIKRALQRDWALLEPSTRKVLAKQLALPTLSGAEQTVTSTGGHFTVHYTVSGADAPDIAKINLYTGLNLAGAADWAKTVAATFETVYAKYAAMGYQPAPTVSGTYDIYLRVLAPTYYGLTNNLHPASSTGYPNSYSSWMELDSSFTNAKFQPSMYSPLQNMQITAAHEYHHAIQYGYTYYFDVWYAEATSTWMEDEVYDSVNQLYNYIPEWFNRSATPLDLTVGPDAVASGAGYGRWIFNRYLAEKHGLPVIRSVWESAGGIASSGGNDIPMLPVLESVLSSATYGSSLGTDFFNFAKRVYTKDWGANPHSADTDLIHPYSPVASYTVYPVNSSVTGANAPSATLPRYSFAYYRFTPAPGMASLSITINKTSGIRTALFTKAGGTPFEAAATDANGTSYVINAFSSTDEVVLLIANVSGLDGHQAKFSTDGSLVSVSEPTNRPPSVSAGSSVNACFIATAAYGSYLHPQVQQLRHFRDTWLLTNAPGRTFVRFYYRFSPPVAQFIARHQIVRGVTRAALTPLVIAVSHPVATGGTVLVLLIALYYPVRRRYRM